MTAFRRLLPLLLAAAVLLASCGAPQEAETVQAGEGPVAAPPAQPSPQVVRVPYDPADSLNPYTCVTLQNFYVTNLIYDSLAALDPAYKAQPRLAQELTRDGAQWIARLRPDARFFDGSPITAQDVVYSYGLAAAGSRFGAALGQVTDVQAPNDATVVFTLARPDIYFDRSLTFPVVKLNTGELPIPMGGGRYAPSDDGTALLANGAYYTPVSNVRRVELVEAGDLESQSYGVMEKTIDLMYSDLRSELNLGLGTGHRQVQMSSLVFLGVNARGALAEPRMRAALSALVDRDDINRKTQMSFASVAYSPIRPSYGGSAVTGPEPGADRADDILDQLGYGTRDTDGYRTAGQSPLTLRLLVNQENKTRTAAAELIAASFEQAGIRTVVEKAPFDTYLGRIAAGDYDLYLGESRVPYNLDILDLLTNTGTVGAGAAQSQELEELYHRVKAGEAPMSQLDTLIRQQTPLIPILYRRGIVCFSRDFSANIVATERDIFYNIGDW